MLVPLVLRNIVLPYLRSGTGASVAATATATAARRLTTSGKHARAEAAVLAERDSVAWEFGARPLVPPPRVGPLPPAQRKPPNRPRDGPLPPPERKPGKEERAPKDPVKLDREERRQKVVENVKNDERDARRSDGPPTKPTPEKNGRGRGKETQGRGEAPSTKLARAKGRHERGRNVAAKPKEDPRKEPGRAEMERRRREADAKLPPASQSGREQRMSTDVKPEPSRLFRRAAILPVSVQKLLGAKLYRAAVYIMLENPEWMADTEMVYALADRLDDKGAGQLAHRLRRTVEVGVVLGANGRVRLWSDPKSKKTAAPTNRVPLVPRAAYPEPTIQRRRTHHWNLLLTQWLTVEHPIPYASPFERVHPNGHTAPPAQLRRLRDVLHTIDGLRERGFVPDRVTTNIVLKAYLNNLSRGTVGEGREARPLPGRAGLRSDDLKQVFRLIAASMEEAVLKGYVLRDGEEPPEELAPKKVKRGEMQKSKPGPSLFGFDGIQPFDPTLNYESHVKPFAQMMRRAMVRVGDHAARRDIEEWREAMFDQISKIQRSKADCKSAPGRKGGERVAEERGKETAPQRK